MSRSKRTRALAISPKVKAEVYARDRERCIFCGRAGLPEGHYISRSRGGLGIPENIVTVCRECHRRMDQSSARAEMLKEAKRYLDIFYPNLSDDNRIYRR